MVLKKIKNIYNWLYNRWMESKGYKRYGFNFKTNTYIYEKKEEIEKWEADCLVKAEYLRNDE